MADISSITLPGGGTYDLKDKNAVPKYGMGKNLLDNWYFVGGGSQLGDGIFPINQRGQTQYSGSGKHIDRWGFGAAGGALELLASGVKITVTSGSQSFAQTLSTSNAFLYGRTVTVSALTAGGNLYYETGTLPNSAPSITTTYISKAIPNVGSLSVVYAASTSRFNVNITNSYISSQSITIAAMKLEFGSEQTLAHQENGVWVLNEIPDYGEELRKCQRYLVRYDTSKSTGIATIEVQTATTAGCIIYLPVTMRSTTPTITTGGLRIFQGSSDKGTPTISNVVLFGNILNLTLTASGMNPTAAARFLLYGSSYLQISCEL